MQLIKAEIESTLISYLRPHFLTIDDVDGAIHVVVIHPRFKPMETKARIKLVFDLLKQYNEDVVRNNTIVVEAFDSDQFQELLEEIF